jgi:ubiquinol-cytochrome c reductase subunit 6
MPLFSFGSFFPSVKAEEEEEELVDPQVTLKESCAEKASCVNYKQKLEQCTERVTSRSQTTESCMEELFDFIHCVDHCVSKELFSKLK